MFTTSRTDIRIDENFFLLLSVFKAHVRDGIINAQSEQKLFFNFNVTTEEEEVE